MAHTTNALPWVLSPAPFANITAAGVAEQRGAAAFGEVDITSYTNGGEVINAAELNLNKIYGGIFQGSESDTYAVRSFEVAAGGKSATLNIDTAGTGTEVSAATDVGRFVLIVWGEMLGSGTN